MSKRKQMKKKRSFGWFIFGMVVYAAVFLTAAYFGLDYLWKYMEAYEASRADNTINAYMEELTTEHIVELSQSVIDEVDHNIQSEEECRTYLLEALSGGVTHARKSKECTDTRQVFVLRTGSKVIGEFSIAANEPDQYGFTTWEFEAESFDMSYLINYDKLTMTVPETCSVWVNGHQLDSSYIVEEGIQYEAVKDYYEEFDLPCQVTYEAGTFLGEMEMTAKDENGEPIVFDENTDYSVYYLNCTEEEAEKLDAFTETFLQKYIDFTGSNKNTRYTTYQSLIQLVLSGSDLATRLEAAVDGLQFGQSLGDEIVSIDTHIQLRIEDGKYMCDVTYDVDTTGKKGVVRQTTNAKLYIVETDNGMKLESMSIY